MGKISEPSPAAFIAGITYADEDKIADILEILSDAFGAQEIKSPVFDFDMTDYYTREMGENLKKFFYCFRDPIKLEMLPDIKLFTNETEIKFSSGNMGNLRRTVNIDPGYITLSKLVLASTKDYSHRIFIGKGIYAETTLRFIKGTFIPLETTYPDYKTPLAIHFFNTVRDFVKRNGNQWMLRKE